MLSVFGEENCLSAAKENKDKGLNLKQCQERSFSRQLGGEQASGCVCDSDRCNANEVKDGSQGLVLEPDQEMNDGIAYLISTSQLVIVGVVLTILIPNTSFTFM